MTYRVSLLFLGFIGFFFGHLPEDIKDFRAGLPAYGNLSSRAGLPLARGKAPREPKDPQQEPQEAKRVWLPSLVQLAPGGAVPDLIIGNPKAPLTIVEYSSLTCHHCAEFHTKVLPEIKKKYIDTGQVKLHFRHFPIDVRSVLAYSIFMCVPPEKQLSALERVFREQKAWMNEKFLENLSHICEIPEDQARQSLSDEKLENAILLKRIQAEQVLPNIDATPFFIVGSHIIDQAPTFEEMDKILSQLVKSL